MLGNAIVLRRLHLDQREFLLEVRVKLHLGYEIGSGAAVEIPLKHLCVCGQTQESGKTTTLEALITRSNLVAIAFVTKRGERSFTAGERMPPYFEERADWEFVQAILEATMRERMKFERAWIVRATKGAKTLADVQLNVRGLGAKAKRSMDQDLYMLLDEYLDKVLPQLDRLPKAPRLVLTAGLNVMDLREYSEELQALVIASTIRKVHAAHANIITIVPEAWKFAPQGRNSPVKHELRKLAREGAGLKNYIWIDSQDIAGVEKELLRAAAVWLIGVQREANELERALASIPKGIRRPTAADVATLGLGQFYACWGEHVHKVYVQPAWLEADDAKLIALGKLPLQEGPKETDDMDEWKRKYEESEKRVRVLEQANEKLAHELRVLQQYEGVRDFVDRGQRAQAAAESAGAPSQPIDLDVLASMVLVRLRNKADQDPGILRILTQRPELVVKVERPVMDVDGSTLRGRIARLIADGFLNESKTAYSVFQELQRLGAKVAKPSVYGEMEKLALAGFVTKEADGFKKAPDAVVRAARA